MDEQPPIPSAPSQMPADGRSSRVNRVQEVFNPSSTPQSKRANKPLPQAGHRAAVKWVVGGFLFYPIFVAILVGPRLATGDSGTGLLEFIGISATGEVAWATLVLVLLGVIVFGASTFITWRVDLKGLKVEELDIDWIHQHDDDAIEWVFEPADQREALYRAGKRTKAQVERHIETLVDERVHRVIEKQRDAAVRVSPDELRVLAESRTTKYGSTARFASGLLLLLAVLGTFSGVKAALPGLIEAAAASERPSTPDAAQPSIATPLERVADAFGANSLALVGAIALGLMAQGMATGRRNLLERLEHVSERLYRGIHNTESLDPMTEAVRELGSAARTMHETAESLKNIETGIAQLEGTFKGSFANLNASLVEITDQQERALNDRTSSTLRALEARVAEMAEVVADNTRHYQGMVERLGASASESREAVLQTRNAVAVLERSMSSLFELEKNANRMSKELEDRIGHLDSGSREMMSRLEQVSATVRSFEPMVSGLQSFLKDTTTRFVEQEQRSTKAWATMTDTIDRQLKTALNRISGIPERPSDDRAQESSPLFAGMAQGIGIVGILGLTYLILRVTRLI